jgi:ectoine hydroxylase-related dioxygenase (phytanoyl-CoA dioxygenase family)
MTMTNDERRHLDEEGFVVVHNALDADEVRAFVDAVEELWRIEGDEAGGENYVERGVRRLANLVAKGDVFRALMSHSIALEAADLVIGANDYRLVMLNARDPLPAELATRDARGVAPTSPFAGIAAISDGQPLHCDSDGRNPDERGFRALTVIWALDPFDRVSGAPRIVPRSHHIGRQPEEVLADIYGPHPDEVIAECHGGDVILINAHAWHGGRNNRGTASRRSLLAHYYRRDMPVTPRRQQQLTPELIARLTPIERELLW